MAITASNTASKACIAIAAVAAFASAVEPGARVQVVFSEPQNFTDVKSDYLGGDKERDFLLGQLRKHLEERAAAHVPDGHRLTVTITDVDMAGDFEPGRNPRLDGARILRAVYPPRINLRFELADAAGQPVKAGQRSLTDLAFLSSPDIRRNDPLKHEKNLLDDWLDREFPLPQG